MLKEKLSEDECLFGQDGDSNPLFPNDSISEEIAKKIDPSFQSVFIKESLPLPTSSFLTSCDFKRKSLVNTSINGINVKVKHRVLIFPDSSSKTLKLYSCAFDDKKSDQCSFEKS